jgi:chaperonin GroES
MDYVTTADRVLIRPEEVEKKTDFGIFIPTFDPDPVSYGTVVQVGPGRTTKKDVTIQVDLTAGDRVMFPSGTGIPVKVDGESFIILKEDEIIGVVE